MESYDIYVSGIVQGVGFRPFIKRISLKSGINGYVQNLGGGEVLIHIEGSRECIRGFFKLFRGEKPPPAEIIYMKITKSSPSNYSDFDILKSRGNMILRSMIPPDIGICEECIKEIDHDTRWNNYAFNSCAWCGPRFSMMYKIPYDRENTSMKDFPLCKDCSKEYGDVHNIRRFHAQGISCPHCGPRLWLTDNKGNVLDEDSPIESAAELLDKGYIVGIKGIGGFHIACRADEDEFLNILRKRKLRPYKPFALMALDIPTIEEIAYVDERAKKLLCSPQRPIVLLRRREDASLSNYIAPGLNTVGVMLPYSGIHYLLLKNTDIKYLIMTSGNYYNKPMEKEAESAIKRIGCIVDYFLLHNRIIINRVDDSVIRFSNAKPTFLRRGRGFAPRWIKLPKNLPMDVISFGAELQNSGGVGFSNKAILTQYIGDTDELENLLELEKYLRWFASIYNIDLSKSIIVIDKHPKYNSSMLGFRWAKKYGSPLIRIQHHVSHAYSILAEYQEREGVVISIDGVGYGDDGNIWGGEAIEVSEDGYKRIGHLQYHKMIGGDLTTIYPARMVFSILAETLGKEEAVKYFHRLNLMKYLRDNKELEILSNRFSIDNLYTSSLGRLLDAFSTLLGICGYRSYEGEPAMKLESYAYGGSIIRGLTNSLEIYMSTGSYVINTSNFFMRVIDSLITGKYVKRDLAYSVQFLLGFYLGSFASDYARLRGYKYVYITGGAAVNDIILKGVNKAVKENKLCLRMHKLVPPGDGGISLGQIYSVTYSFNLVK